MQADPASAFGTVWFLITTGISCPSSSFWYPVSSLVSSLACLYNPIVNHSLRAAVAHSCKDAMLPTSRLLHSLSDFTFWFFKTWFSWSFLWTPRALFHVFFTAPIPPYWTLLTRVVCLSHDNVNSLRELICGSSGISTWWVRACKPWVKSFFE